MLLERTEKLIANPLALSNIVRRMALEAGEIVLSYYEGEKDIVITDKGDFSPVTNADEEAEKYIQDALFDLTPDIPFIGEEFIEQGGAVAMAEHGYCWFVDALDGTKAFIRGEEQFTVNIALVYDGEPVLGVVYAPAMEVLYVGVVSEEHAVKYSVDCDKEKKIRVRDPHSEGIVVVSSVFRPKGEAFQSFIQNFKVQKLVQRSSSIKLCMIAEGKADMYPRFGPTSFWDIAAGHAVVAAAGGCVLNLSGHSLRYDHVKEDYTNPDFAAASFNWFEMME